MPLKLSGKAFTALIDGKIIAVGGAVIYWQGVGEAWIIISENVNEYKSQMAFCIRSIMDRLISELKLRRLQAVVRCDFDRAIALVDAMGFVCEGKMEKYLSDGSSAWLYAKLIED